MLNITRIILSIITVGFSFMVLVTEQYHFMPYLMLFLGATVLLTGLVELRKSQGKLVGYLCIIVSLFIFLVSFF